MSESIIIKKKINNWVAGSRAPVKPYLIQNIINLLDQPLPRRQDIVLNGRASVTKTTMEGIGPVIIKQYLRGGMVQRLIKDRYFKTGPCRARKEFEILLKSAALGINVPVPILYFRQGLFFYKCWLATKEIPHNGSIAQISLTCPESAAGLMGDVMNQVQKLIDNRIYHVDLHPGNILAGRDAKIYLIDFDKACITKRGGPELEKKYINRWNRAVLKHRLPKTLLVNSFFKTTN